MKIRKMVSMVAVVAFLIVFFAGARMASASYWLYNASVVKISQQANGAAVTVTSGTTTLQKYLAEATEKSMLAILLSADAQGKKVHVYLDTSTNEITAVVLSNE